MRYEEQYLNLVNTILEKGKWVSNDRTGKACLTIPEYSMTYTKDDPPLLTVKKSYPVSAFAEKLGYLRGYNNAIDFDRVGTKSWYDNANKTQAWLDNPNRVGENHLGSIYGVIARDFGGVDLVKKVFNNLSKGVDDRSEIITYYKPDEFDKGCLRPCMHSHQFTILDNTLYLNSNQRSCDVPLGLNYNSIQCYLFLKLMAKICNLEMGYVKHNIVSPHIYEDQMESVLKMVERKPLPYSSPTLEIAGWINTLEDVIDSDRHARDYIKMSSYYHLGAIDFPMSS